MARKTYSCPCCNRSYAWRDLVQLGYRSGLQWGNTPCHQATFTREPTVDQLCRDRSVDLLGDGRVVRSADVVAPLDEIREH